MKTKILAITLFVICAFIACKKVGENIQPTYSDAELRINKNSTFADEERKIKEGIMGFSALSKNDRLIIVKNLIMENKHPKSIINGMDILNKLDLNEQVELIAILLSTSNFTIYSNLSKINKYQFTNPTTGQRPKSCWVTIYDSYQYYGCPFTGSDVCFKFVPENCN